MDRPIDCTNSPVFQHSSFTFYEDSTIFSSEFDSGNLAKVERVGIGIYHLWTGPDCTGTKAENSCRTWFYFKMTAPQGLTVTFTVKNLNLQGKLFRDGMKPVIKTPNEDWKRICSPVTFNVSGDVGNMFELTFMHHFQEKEAYFAFCHPWSYSEHLKLLTEIQNKDGHFYLHRENLINSLEGRKCDVLTVSSWDGILEQTEVQITNLYPDPLEERAKRFSNKKIVVVSARVHPGETPGSHVMNGFLKFITSDDPRACMLRDSFVFKIIPMLNPDGVYRGHYRTDTRGLNLNRFYTNPSLLEHPTIYGVKELIMSYHKEDSELVYLYVDLHGHASKKGCFIYGNYMDFPRQIDSCLFAKLMSLNCVNFDFEGSNFSEKNMHAKDKCGLSKDGSGRVALYKACNITRCYTLECNYNTGRLINKIPPLDLPESTESDISNEIYKNGPPVYSIPIYEDVGKAIGISLLDSIGKNCNSRVLQNDPELKNVKLQVAAYIADQIPFRYDLSIKKAVKSVDDLENYFKSGGKTIKPRYKKHIDEESKKRRVIRNKTSASSCDRKKVSQNSEPVKKQNLEKPKEINIIPVRNYNFPKSSPDLPRSAINRGRQITRTVLNPFNRGSRSASTKSCGDEASKRSKSIERDNKMITVIEAVGE